MHVVKDNELWTPGNVQCSWLFGRRHLPQGVGLFRWVHVWICCECKSWHKCISQCVCWKQSLACLSGHFSTTCTAESIKDLIRYLRHEDDTRDVRQQLGAGQIIQNDLLPIITQHGHDKTLFDACIRYEKFYLDFFFLMNFGFLCLISMSW